MGTLAQTDVEAALIRRWQISHYSDYILCKIIRHICGPSAAAAAPAAAPPPKMCLLRSTLENGIYIKYLFSCVIMCLGLICGSSFLCSGDGAYLGHGDSSSSGSSSSSSIIDLAKAIWYNDSFTYYYKTFCRRRRRRRRWPCRRAPAVDVKFAQVSWIWWLYVFALFLCDNV